MVRCKILGREGLWFGILIFLFAGMVSKVEGQVVAGVERTEAYMPMLKGKRIGVVANNASVIKGVNTVDTLLALGCDVVKIFSPEHGFRKQVGAGVEVGNKQDELTGIEIISLYGKNRKPSDEDLKGVDLMVFDIQDVGVRFYTYISTLSYLMEACAENGIPLFVFDRPNPNGFYIDGPVLDPKFSSFVGLHPVPVVYGMTIGEYARMVNGEGWLKDGIQCDLEVIQLENWTHHTFLDTIEAPSPNLPTLNSIYLYPSLCFFEGTDISVGRGTSFPFEVVGHPAMKGFSFSFTPVSIPGKSLHPPHEGELCLGLDLREFYKTHSAMYGRINLAWLMMAYKNMGSRSGFFNAYFDKLAGTDLLREQILKGSSDAEIRQSWQDGIERFKSVREKYLLYK
ncbi:exo-beta-N-acetylmuramidase NamZ domain-containing protein [Bacteroidota bacterium]